MGAIGLWTVLGLQALPAQTAPSDPRPTPDLEILERLARSSADPLLRGEAALALAQAGDPWLRGVVEAVAGDPSVAARLRGILAVGTLSAPGAQGFLGEILERYEPGEAEHQVAAYALGTLPAGTPTPALDAYLVRHWGGSFGRTHDAFAALYFGLAQSPHPDRRQALLQGLEDAGRRFPELHALAILALTAIEGAVTPAGVVEHHLRHRVPAHRHAALLAIAAGAVTLDRADLDPIRRMAAKDRDRSIRAAALDVLLKYRDPSALELAPRALRSRDPAERTAGLGIALSMGGNEARTAIERMVLDERDEELQRVMLCRWSGRRSQEFVDDCFTLAANRDLAPDLRAAALAVVAAVDEDRSRPLARDLLRHTRDPRTLDALVQLLRQDDSTPDLIRRIYPEVDDRSGAFPRQLAALFRVGHAEALPTLERCLEDERFEDRFKGELLQAWRIAGRARRSPPALMRNSLPQSLRDLLF